MKRLLLGLGLIILWCGLALPAHAVSGCETKSTAMTFPESFLMGTMICDLNGNMRSTLGTLLSGEDQTNNVMRVESQFSYALDDADLVVKATPGFLHAVVCYGEDGTAEAGSVAIRDAASAGTGTIVYQETIAAAAYTSKYLIFDILMPTGIVIDFTTTTDVFCLVSYR